jgi:hypothetical protein
MYDLLENVEMAHKLYLESMLKPDFRCGLLIGILQLLSQTLAL